MCGMLCLAAAAASRKPWGVVHVFWCQQASPAHTTALVRHTMHVSLCLVFVHTCAALPPPAYLSHTRLHAPIPVTQGLMPQIEAAFRSHLQQQSGGVTWLPHPLPAQLPHPQVTFKGWLSRLLAGLFAGCLVCRLVGWLAGCLLAKDSGSSVCSRLPTRCVFFLTSSVCACAPFVLIRLLSCNVFVCVCACLCAYMWWHRLASSAPVAACSLTACSATPST